MRIIKVKDMRALFGGIAVVITGVILASMLSQYFSPTTGALSRSRLWWEVALNIQILSVGMIWFCYSDRIDSSVGMVRRLQIIRLFFTLITILLPSFFGLVGIFNNWFEEEPSPRWVSLFCVCVFLYWLAGLWVHRLVQRRRQNPPKPTSWRYDALFYTPITLLIVISVVDAPQGGRLWLYAIPVLTYMQGAMPFFTKAWGLR